jgi:mycothiol synthase
MHTAGMLPAGHTSRSPEPEDLDDIAALVTACELADLDETMLTREDIRVGWAQPNLDLSRDAILILHEGRIVARAETFRTRAEVSIHPNVRGRGLGTWLLEWVEERGRVKGETQARQSLLDRATGAAAMLRSHGYEAVHTSWILEIALEQEPPEPALPAGVSIRDFVPGQDDQKVYRVIDDAFNEWPDREPEAFEDWAAEIVLRSDFDPGLLKVAVEDGAIVGACVGLDYPDEGGWIQQLAVRASHRNRGIARALLETAFQTSWKRGERTCGVSTDSRTGALGLYEHAGMHVKTTATTYRKSL